MGHWATVRTLNAAARRQCQQELDFCCELTYHRHCSSLHAGCPAALGMLSNFTTLTTAAATCESEWHVRDCDLLYCHRIIITHIPSLERSYYHCAPVCISCASLRCFHYCGGDVGVAICSPFAFSVMHDASRFEKY